MPEWLLSYCVNACILAGGVISTLLFAFLVVVLSVEIYDFFVEEKEAEANGYEEDY